MTERFDETGRKLGTKEMTLRLLKEQGICLASGIGMGRRVSGNGYRYRGAHIDSFCQLRGAQAIRLARLHHLSWCARPLHLIPERWWPDSGIHADAPNGTILVFEYAMGNGAAYPQPNGYFALSIDDRELFRFTLQKSSWIYDNPKGARLYLEVRRKRCAAPGESFMLDEFVKDENLYVNGLAYLYLPVELAKSCSRFQIRITAHQDDRKSKRWFRLGDSFQLLNCDLTDGLRTLLSPCERPQIDGQPVFFGDIHVHTAQSGSLKGKGCGRGTVEENLRYARDVSALDFCAITDHDWQLDASDWRELRCENDRFYEPGHFVTLHAYEWTSANYGHRNVYFRSGALPDNLAPFDYQKAPHKPVKYGRPSLDDPTPEELWRWLNGTGLTAMTIPHHPNAEQFPMNLFRYFSEKYDRCVEVYSTWGSFFTADRELNLCSDHLRNLAYEHYANKLRFGFVASSDGHDGCAGSANLTNDKKHMAHYLGSGIVAVAAPALTREAIFDAIHDRRCYALTGARILLSFSLNGKGMGSIVEETADVLRIRIHAIGEDELRSLRLYNNAKLIWENNSYTACECCEDLLLAPEPGSYYVEVIQQDSERAWSSPIWYEPK